MPLSDREQRILEEIEKNILQEDPAFGRGVGRARRASHGRRTIHIGAALLLGGIVALILFFATGAVAAGVVAFGAMVGGIVVIAGGVKDSVAGDAAKAPLNERFGAAARSWEERLRSRYRKR